MKNERLIDKEGSIVIKKPPRPADNFRKYKIKHIPKNRDILENSTFDFITKSSDRMIYKTSQGLYIQCDVDNGS